jgi:hypothetical protein
LVQAITARPAAAAVNTWVSSVDSGIVEGIERGMAIASGGGTDTFGKRTT